MRALDQSRDEHVDSLRRRLSRGPRLDDHVLQEVERFREWLHAERRRIKWTYERYHQESWLRAVTATDDRGRTPIHWAASGISNVSDDVNGNFLMEKTSWIKKAFGNGGNR